MRATLAILLTLAIVLGAPAQAAPPEPTFPGTNIPYPKPPKPAAEPPRAKPAEPSKAKPATPPAAPAGDGSVRRTQADAGNPPPVLPDASLPVSPAGMESGSSLSLQAALYGAITGNPDLISLRNSNIASPESVEVARRFPTTLNPTLWTDIRPWTWTPTGHGYRPTQGFVYLSLRQPVELGHQTTHRYEIAKAAYNQQQWTVVQAEMMAMVQTYRFFQTAAYRRDKLRLAHQLADFNDRLLQSLQRRLEANQVSAADVSLAEVENQATRQLVEVARQDYANALTDLHNQIGTPETAGTAEPFGEFALPGSIPPVDDSALIQIALQSRPDIHVARAQVAGACAAVKLAKGDRIPTPIIGPEYEKDQAGVEYLGFVVITPLPYINNGTPLVRQREADYRRAVVALRQAEQRAVTQVKAAVAKWNSANRLVGQTSSLINTLRTQVDRMEKLFNAGQSDLTKLLQTRQRLLQLENADLDALWQATQAQADLLTALGAPALLSTLQASNDPAAAPTSAPPVPR